MDIITSTIKITETSTVSITPTDGFYEQHFFNPEFWTLLVSLVPSIVALFIAGGIGQYVKPFLGIKPNIKIITLKRYRQADKYWRLAIKNSGNEVAISVQIDVTCIYDGGKARENFLPIPLRWTHINKESRNILPGQVVYLDVMEQKNSGEQVKLITNSGGGVGDFEVLKNGKTKIVLTIYVESGKSFNKTIEINWPAGMFFDARLEGEKWHLTKNGKWL